MRLWTLHPGYLDSKGLVALWREALLAKKVLSGRTTGYRHHPQLRRFRESTHPLWAIGAYLRIVYEESVRRGYHFDEGKLSRAGRVRRITTTSGQLRYEFSHLRKKLERRDRALARKLKRIRRPKPHPLFRITRGTIEAWEKVGKI